jgi:hypothetical protein
LIGTARGELSASGLDGLRQAGSWAYSLADEADRIREEAGADPWQRERGTQLFLVCAWIAFALQTAADQLVDSDARADPLTAGLLPEATLAFTQACYVQAITWVRHARCVQADAAYRVNVPLPAALPPWQQSAQTSDVHLRGLRDAYEAVAPRAEFELGRLAAATPPERTGALADLKLLAAQMRTALEFAGGSDRTRRVTSSDARSATSSCRRSGARSRWARWLPCRA